MEATQRESGCSGDCAVSVELTDAYLHVPMHRATMKYLRFAMDGEILCFRAMLFGLSTAPWAFTRLTTTVVAPLPGNDSLGDLQLLRRQPTSPPSSTSTVVGPGIVPLSPPGVRVDCERQEVRSHSQPAVSHLGMTYDTVEYTVRPRDERIHRIVVKAHDFLAAQTTTPRKLATLQGMMTSRIGLVPAVGLRLRPFPVDSDRTVGPGNLRVGLDPSGSGLAGNYSSSLDG